MMRLSSKERGELRRRVLEQRRERQAIVEISAMIDAMIAAGILEPHEKRPPASRHHSE